MFWRWYPKSCVMLVEALTFRAGPGRIAACGHRPCSSSTRQQLLPPPCPAKPTPPFRPLTHCTLSIGSHLKPQRAGLQERGSDARAVGLHVQKPQQRRQQGQVLGAHALRSPPRPFCVSIFLDKNRRCIWIATPPPPNALATCALSHLFSSTFVRHRHGAAERKFQPERVATHGKC
jgi:hypothetical protein